MLLAIRERVIGIVGWVLLGILAVAFTFFGLSSYLTSSSPTYAALVDDVRITSVDHQRAYRRLKIQMEELMGENYNPALINEARLRRISLESLIVDQLLIDESNRQKYAVSESSIIRAIDGIEFFKEDGVFSKNKYERTLRLQGITPQRFEGQMAREDKINQLRSAISSTSISTPGMFERTFSLTAQTREFNYVVIPASDYESEITVSQDEVEKYYSANENEYLTDERVQLEYIELVASEIEIDTYVSDDDLLALYEENIDQYTEPEERKASHILIAISPDDDDAELARKKALAEKLSADLKSGAVFETLAREHSDDPGSAGAGGDLGFFGKGLMAPEFEAEAFRLSKGGVSEIVRTTFGYHIIRVDDVKGGKVTSFEDVEEALRTSVTDEIRDDLFFERSDLLANLVYETQDNLSKAADELGIEIKRTGWITKAGGENLGALDNVVSAAFSPEVLLDGSNSEVIEAGTGRVVVVRIGERKAAETLPLDEVKTSVEATIRKQKLLEIAENKGQEILKEIAAGANFHETSKKMGLTVINSGPVARDDQKTAREILREAFQLKYPEEGHSVSTAFALASGDYLVMSLLEVKQGNPNVIQSETRKKYRAELNQRQGIKELGAVVDYLKGNAVIDIPSS